MFEWILRLFKRIKSHVSPVSYCQNIVIDVGYHSADSSCSDYAVGYRILGGKILEKVLSVDSGQDHHFKRVKLVSVTKSSLIEIIETFGDIKPNKKSKRSRIRLFKQYYQHPKTIKITL